jgi:hypothetical protein
MILPRMKERLSLQREMSLREVLLADLMFVVAGVLMAAVLILFSPLILLGILGNCEYPE